MLRFVYLCAKFCILYVGSVCGDNVGACAFNPHNDLAAKCACTGKLEDGGRGVLCLLRSTGCSVMFTPNTAHL